MKPIVVYVSVVHRCQKRAPSKYYKGLGPGNFLSVLVTFEVLTSMLSS